MKKLLTFIIGVIGIWIILAFTTKTYCDGWEKGYKRGYCYKVQNCIEPIVPTCPIPEIGFETYQDGLDRGFVEGKNKRNEKDI